ncbi:LacI family DNA-binding transcriptional regulator [Xanthobacteraceae bacterium Astr-EGSB]|uniref:LacI family DNA-binding transcriptional regulator n=1 Tax=Astrobacterium formosum TaxID=3069710 RepID=UPI0027B3A9D2|nr:LacI family DNA-binding transcriptional regulator [Xanthobacteraceae bacterium Astr-EGSB]
MPPKSEQRATIQDIARAAQVSPATVSLVLNRKGNISENTRTKIWKIAEEMQFVPNSIARALRRGRTFSLGVVVNHLQNHFFTSVFSGIERVTDAQGFTILVSQTHDDVNKERSQVQLLTERGVDGLILFPCSQEWSHVDTVVQRFGLPTVLIGNYFENKEYLSFVADNWSGACKAVQHLIALARQPIIHMAGPPTQTMCLIRRRAFESTISENFPEISTSERIFPVAALTPAEGYRVMAQILEHYCPPVSLFVINDDTALGVLRLCADRGLRIPEDVALIGFSDIPTLSTLSIPLSTVRIPGEAMGEKAATTLIESIKSGKPPLPMRVELPVELILRGSTNLPAARGPLGNSSDGR